MTEDLSVIFSQQKGEDIPTKKKKEKRRAKADGEDSGVEVYFREEEEDEEEKPKRSKVNSDDLFLKNKLSSF